MRRSLLSVSRALTISFLVLTAGRSVFAAQNPSSSEYTLIQGVKVLKSTLKEVGDIDGNGVLDFVSLTPDESGDAGAIRIYMMKNKDNHLFTRHITTGKWGFNLPLRKGDKFGSAVAKIGDINGDGIQDIAVGAPGDKSDGKTSGAVYVLMMGKQGHVLQAVKISAASDGNLRKQHKKKEGFGTAITAIQDVNGDNVKELSVESTDGSKTLVLLNKNGQSISSMKFASGVDPKNLQPRFLTGKIRVMPLRIDGMGNDDEEEQKNDAVRLPSLSAKPVESGLDGGVGCFFNSTACACREFASASICLDTVATENGQTVCKDRPCNPNYKCDCTGTKLCSRKETTESNYQRIPGTPSERGLSFCEIRPSTMMRTYVIPGADVPTSSGLSGSGGGGVWNAKMCSCSAKNKFTSGTTQCMDFARKDGGQDICTVRNCQTAADMVCDINGKSTCERSTRTRDVYVNKGSNRVDGEAKCGMVTITLETAHCVDNCPAESVDTSPLR